MQHAGMSCSREEMSTCVRTRTQTPASTGGSPLPGQYLEALGVVLHPKERHAGVRARRQAGVLEEKNRDGVLKEQLGKPRQSSAFPAPRLCNKTGILLLQKEYKATRRNTWIFLFLQSLMAATQTNQRRSNTQEKTEEHTNVRTKSCVRNDSHSRHRGCGDSILSCALGQHLCHLGTAQFHSDRWSWKFQCISDT